MTRSSRSTNAATILASQVGQIQPWPDVVGAPTPVESVLFSRNQRFRAPDDWTNRPGDLIELARLCKLQATALDCQREIDNTGPVITNAKGAKLLNPYLVALGRVNADIAALKRSLGVGTQSQAEKRKAANRAAEFDRASETFGGDNELLN